MHDLLHRQLKRCFGTGVIPHGIEDLLDAVDQAYRERDTEQKRAEEERRELARTRELLSRAQDQLRQPHKMEVVGRLAGGVAHDFNNVLTAIRGYCDIARARLNDEACVRRSIREISAASERAATLTRQLLAFSRQQVLQPRLLDLNTCLRGMDVLLRRLIGERVQLSTELEPRLRPVLADPGQVEQILMNLVVNAKDAMADGGRITIRTVNVSAEAGASRAPRAGAPSVMLSVSDSGCGMDAATVARIFDPFFTTKPVGQGTGLGLSTVFGIVEQSHGRIWVDSKPGRGTTFEIYLPEAASAAESDERDGIPEGIAPGHETLLLVEDEDVVRDVAREMLGIAGYHVLVARDGAEALRVCTDHEGTIDLIMTDVVMPGMGGQELAERVRKLNPTARILFTSGYASHADFHDGTVGIGREFLQKPFTFESLTNKVREVLDAPRASEASAARGKTARTRPGPRRGARSRPRRAA